MPGDRARVDAISRNAYLSGRVVLTALLPLLAVIGLFGVARGREAWLFWTAVALLAVGTAVVAAANRTAVPAFVRVMWVVLPLDMCALGVLVFVLHAYEDPAYPLFLGMALGYSAIAKRRYGWAAISSATAAVYVAAHVLSVNGMDPGNATFLVGKAGVVVFFSYLVATALERGSRRESEVLHAHAEVEQLNEDMERRLTELRAVSEISEVIHSTLDFEAIGPVVIEIVQKVIDIPASSLFVIDKQRAETLFCASQATSGAMYSPGSGVAQILDGEDMHFTCMQVLDREDVMVVFCASADKLESMRHEDRIVLQTIASELVVAVENSRLYKLTKRMAVTDELSGLYNYRYLQQRLDEEVERARRYDKSLSLLMLDVDDFKIFNDTNGHLAGDRALAALARVILATVREVDVVARYGGEEFSVLLPETDEPGAYVAAEKIREAISRHAFAGGGGGGSSRLTVSIGLASMPAHAGDKEGLLQQADEALYQAKSHGKDRVRSSHHERHADGGLAEEAV